MKTFISYAHADTSHILNLQHALEVHEVWIDQRLSVGQEWWKEIEQRISACNCFLLLLSSHYVASEYCQKELEFALRLEKPIAPVRLEPIDIPVNLNRFQVINVFDGLTTEGILKIVNGLVKIEREVFTGVKELEEANLYFATTNQRKK